MTSIARTILAALLCAAAAAHAQPAWRPEKSVEIIIGTSPGGPQDRMGRTLQKVLQESRLVEVPVSVENKPGGGGAVALAALAQRTGGSTLMINAPTMLNNQITGKSPLPYTDFTALAILGIEYECVAVRADSPLKSAKELVDRLKKDPSALSVSIGTSLGNAGHLAYALAMKAAGVDIKKLKTVAFNSAGDGITALLGGHIDLHIGSVGPLAKQLEAGKVRLLAVTSDQRLPGPLATIPTWKEQGIAGTFNTWRGLWGPKGMTAEQVAFWDDALERISKDPQWKENLAANQWESDYRNSRDTLKYLDVLHVELRDVLKDLGGLAKKLD